MERAYEREVDPVTGQSVSCNCEARHTFSLENFKAHANGAGKDNVGANSISETQGQNPWQPAVCKLKHEHDQPDTHDAQPEDKQALQ